MFSVWKHKVATVDLTIRNRGIFGTCLSFFIISFIDVTITIICLFVLWCCFLNKAFMALMTFFIADKSPPMIKKTICTTPCTTSPTTTTPSTTPPLRPFSAFESSVYGDPRSFGTPYIRRRDICYEERK